MLNNQRVKSDPDMAPVSLSASDALGDLRRKATAKAVAPAWTTATAMRPWLLTKRG